ncbi:hypothetical protein CONLIGDRAFT_680237 [Coniochaeta ligniaria NRRL 30616]|uniref:Uncharacterized protein n=1 Tax=Coniochaeta ligniaria NRRL 30616 TaxID=1408157 RepID=A0A1J7JNR3_9PEZI|nr:hypothetical protein CONLIGDRAFT_680237 [Coniochaeta ligniaria NRRL 30616]
MAVADQATTIVALAQRQLDRVVSPSTRRETWDRTLDLAARRPGVFTFIAVLAALSLPPILLFTTFVLSTLLLTLGAAILFTLFWTGVALFLLVPSLFIAAGCAIFLWTWAVGSFIAARWLAQRTGFDFGFGSSSEGQGQVAKANGGQHKTATLDGRFDVYEKEPGIVAHDVKLEL